jgi:ubiquinone/menaquinone biosynthesis C-methylase UbiE
MKPTQITPTVDQIKEQVNAEWTDPVTVSTFRKWHAKSVVQTHEATDALVQLADVADGLSVLDIASGTGEPAITLAKAVGPKGRVIATDLAQGMLEVAQENAHRAGVTNLSFQQADGHCLPFPDEAFDRVTCRFGVMYFADVGEALREIRRVLRRGGLLAVTAWGPMEENTLAVSAMVPFLKRVSVPPSAPGSPNPFKFASPGSLSTELKNAGFERIAEHARTIDCSWPGPPEELWECFSEIANPLLGPIMDSMTPEDRQFATNEVIEAYGRCYNGQRVKATVGIVLATGMR